MKDIPIGLSSFVQAVNEDYLVIDKSKELLHLVQHYKFAFLSRPRQFGKSLLLSAIKTLFEKGIEPYFKVTYIAGNNDDGSSRWIEPTYPVISLDFSAYQNKSLDDFRQLFVCHLNSYTKEFGIEPIELNIDIAQTFEEFVHKLALKFPKGFVLLIDEYNTPLNSLIDDPKEFKQIEAELNYFYNTVMSSTVSCYIKFLLVTGITQYEELHLSAYNLRDATYDSNLATILGYTKDELLYYFKDYLKIAIEKLHHCKSENLDSNTYQAYLEALLKTLETYYGNYCFDEFGKKTVFSPWSINNFFKEAAEQTKILFDDYWFEAGGNRSELSHYLKHHFKDFLKIYQNQFYLDNFSIKHPSSIHDLDFIHLLLQTGYLSLAKGSSLIDGGALVTLPNLELRQALTRRCLYEIFGDYALKLRLNFNEFIKTATALQLFDLINEILATAKKHQISLENEMQVKTLFEMFALSTGVNCFANSHQDLEKATNDEKSCSSLNLETETKTIDIVFIAHSASFEDDKKPSLVLDKIIDKDYNQSFDCNKTRLKMAVVYDANEKNLVAFKEC